MNVSWLAFLGFALACQKPASPSLAVATLPSATTSPSASIAAATPNRVLDADDSGLVLKGPIPAADGALAMQLDDQYGPLQYGRAVLGPNGLFVHLTDAPLKCDEWPRPPHLSITISLTPGPDGDFFVRKITSTHVEYSRRGFGHVDLDPFELAEGKHLAGRIAYSDPGSGHHNGAVVKPSRAAGRFDVEICEVKEEDKAALRAPSELVATAPLAFKVGRLSSAPKTILAMIEYDRGDSQPWVSRVEAFEQANVDCDSPFVKSGLDMKVYFGIVASDLGTAQPARLEPDGASSRTMRESRIAWIRFEPFDLATATTAKGSMIAYARPYDTDPGATTPEHLAAASLTGTFEAKVCRFGSKFGKPYM